MTGKSTSSRPISPVPSRAKVRVRAGLIPSRFLRLALDLESNPTDKHVFSLRAGQELSDQTHPHLRLNETTISVPKVAPGSQVYWHCDGESRL